MPNFKSGFAEFIPTAPPDGYSEYQEIIEQTIIFPDITSTPTPYFIMTAYPIETYYPIWEGYPVETLETDKVEYSLLDMIVAWWERVVDFVRVTVKPQ